MAWMMPYFLQSAGDGNRHRIHGANAYLWRVTCFCPGVWRLLWINNNREHQGQKALQAWLL